MAKLNVLVIDSFDEDQLLEKQLRSHEFEVATLKPQHIDLVQIVNALQPDVMILNLYTPDQAILDMILDINQHYSMPVIMFAEDQQTQTINKVIQAGVSAYIVDGFEPKRIKSIVDIAIARFTQQQALKDELQKTKDQLEERKFVDRAKGILSKSQGYSEDQAYHALRKLAMDRKLSLGEMAKNVIAMADFLK